MGSSGDRSWHGVLLTLCHQAGCGVTVACTLGSKTPSPTVCLPKIHRNSTSCPLSRLKSGNRFKTLSLPCASWAVYLRTTAAGCHVFPMVFWGIEGTGCQSNHERLVCLRVPNPLPSLSPVFTYSAASKETCARHHGRCSPHAFCTDYATGVCCHCRATYYGNGRQCLPEGTWGGWQG